MKNIKSISILYSITVILFLMAGCNHNITMKTPIFTESYYEAFVIDLSANSLGKGISVTWIDPSDKELLGVKISWVEVTDSRSASTKLEENSIIVTRSSATNRVNSVYLEAINKFENNKHYLITASPVNKNNKTGRVASTSVVYIEPTDSNGLYRDGINNSCSSIYIYRQKISGGYTLSNYDYYTSYNRSFSAGTSEKTIVEYYKNYSFTTGFTYSGLIQMGNIVYLFYNRNSITVNFYLDNLKTELYKTYTGLYGTSFSTVQNPTKEGYVFNFWSTNGVSDTGYNTMFSGNIDYIAVWGPDHYDESIFISLPSGDIGVTKTEYSSYVYFRADSGYDYYKWYIDGVLKNSTTSYSWYCYYSNLTEGVSDVVLLAQKGEVCYSACFSITVDRSPNSVTSLTAIRGEKKITLNWVNPIVNDLEKVQITYGDQEIEIDAASGVYMTKVIEGLEDGTSYTFYLYAVDTGGKKSSSTYITTATLFPRKDSAVVPATPAATIGTASKANILSNLPDVIYLAQSTRSSVQLRCEVDDYSLYFYQWYTSTDGISFTLMSGYNSFYIDCPITDGITYFYLEITHKDTITYSNICRVEKNTLNTDKIGYIYYSDNTYSFEYNKNKIPIGVVCSVDDNGKPSKIVSLDQAANKVWCRNNYNIIINTNDLDGSVNWNIIKTADPTGAASAATEYSAFDWCNKKTIGSKKWYLPAYYEGLQLQYNYLVINNAIDRILDLTIMAVKLDSSYWTSSQYKYYLNDSTWYRDYAWYFYSGNSGLSSNFKNDNKYVRAMAKL